VLGELSQSSITKLGSIGLEAVLEKEKYTEIIKELTENKAVSF
jgi:hypothetical protein